MDLVFASMANYGFILIYIHQCFTVKINNKNQISVHKNLYTLCPCLQFIHVIDIIIADKPFINNNLSVNWFLSRDHDGPSAYRFNKRRWPTPAAAALQS